MSSNMHESITTISDLPDECLREIFVRIPLSTTPGKSFVSLRAVCKRWSPIIDDCWREFKELVFHDGVPHLTLYASQTGLIVKTSNESLRRKTAKQFIQRCGPYLKKLSDCRTLASTPSIMPLAIKECPNLEEFFGLVGSKTDGQQLRDLLDACDKLKTLKIIIRARKVYNFFQRIPTHQLVWLTLSVNFGGDRHLLKYVRATIRHCHVLKGLKIDYMDAELLGLLTTLSELYLGRPNLDIFDPYRAVTLINDELVMSISKTCRQLTSLVLEKCLNVTDDGISALSSLPKLKFLSLLNLPQVTGKYLKNFPKLDEIFLRGCPAGDAEVIEILRNCQVLRVLDVRMCDITNATLAAAVEVTKSRTNNITLQICCDHTKINLELFHGVSPLLEFVRNECEVPL